MAGLFGQTEKKTCCCGINGCCSCDDTYRGCMQGNAPNDPCLNLGIAGEVWFLGTPDVVASGLDWGDLDCQWYWDQNFGLSLSGCDATNVRTTFWMRQVLNPSAWAIEQGVEDCDWVLEIYADGVYQSFILEYAKECLNDGSENPLNALDWIQFYNVPVPGATSTVTLTMVRLESPTSLCVPEGRPGV